MSDFKHKIQQLVGLPPSDDDVPLQVVGVNITGSGADRTTNKLLEAFAKPYFSIGSADAMVKTSQDLQRTLANYGIFSDVNFSFDFVGSSLGVPQVQANIGLPAVKKFLAQTGTNFGNGEGYGYLKGTSKNYFGFGEIISLDTHMGTRTKQSHLFTVSVPGALIDMPLDWKCEGLGYLSSKVADWAFHRQQVQGVTLRVVSPTHSFGVDAVLRTLYSTSPKTLRSPTFCAQAGNAVKMSAFYNYVRDTRDDRFLPSRGSLVELHHEVSGGDHPAIKVHANLATGGRWGPLSWTTRSRLGFLKALYGQSHLMDRFYMGGPTDVRSFAMNCAGPHEGPVSVGGEVLAAAGLSVYAPVPRVKSENLKLHAFLNAGSLSLWRPGVLQTMLQPVVSSGFGVLYKHPMARFEVNLGMPLVASQGDGLIKGLQLGVGFEFL